MENPFQTTTGEIQQIINLLKKRILKYFSIFIFRLDM